jgi:hypothetical protein
MRRSPSKQQSAVANEDGTGASRISRTRRGPLYRARQLCGTRRPIGQPTHYGRHRIRCGSDVTGNFQPVVQVGDGDEVHAETILRS